MHKLPRIHRIGAPREDAMKRTRRLMLLIGALSFAGFITTVSAQRDGVAVVGVLVGAAAPNDRAVEAFRAGLRELGQQEGRNLKIEFRTAQGHPDRLVPSCVS